MARLLSIGCEHSLEWDGNSGGSFTVTNARTGNAYRVTGLASGTSQRGRMQFSSAAANGPFFFRVYFRAATLPSAENRILYVSNSATQNTGVIAYITLDSTGALRLYDEDGQIGSASSALSTGTYYRIGMEVGRGGAAGSHVVRARVDGTEFAGAGNRDLSSGISQFYVGGNLALEAQTTGDWSFDDIAVNDGSGSYEYSYPGDGAYILLRPDSAGDNNAWTNDFTAVDETTPNDATDFQASNTLNQIFDHNLGATPAGVGSGDTIKLVAVNARLSGSAASANAAFVLRCKSGAGLTVQEGTPITPSDATWRTNTAAGGLTISKLILYALPGTSNTYWSKATLDTAQIGARISTGNTNAAQISAIWLGVEYSSVPRASVVTGKFLSALSS